MVYKVTRNALSSFHFLGICLDLLTLVTLAYCLLKVLSPGLHGHSTSFLQEVIKTLFSIWYPSTYQRVV